MPANPPLLSVMAAAKPKITDTPSTTITPQLGMVEYRDGEASVLPTCPVLLEGAAEGERTGTTVFCRHIEHQPGIVIPDSCRQ